MTHFLEKHPDIREILTDCPETTCEALAALGKKRYPKTKAYKEIARCLKDSLVPIPKDFPCSDACIQYGKAIAAFILAEEKKHDAQ